MFPRSFGNEETISKGQFNLPKCEHRLALSTEFVEDI